MFFLSYDFSALLNILMGKNALSDNFVIIMLY